MRTLLFLFLLLFSQFQYLTAQTIGGVVRDEDTRKPLSNVKLFVYNNSFTKTLEIISEPTGNFNIPVSGFCESDSFLNIRASRISFQTTFFSINCKKHTAYEDFKLKNTKRCGIDTAFIIYKPAQVEVNCDEFYKLIELTNALREDLQAIVVLTFYYSPQEKDGYNLSLARANYISGFISKYGALSENYAIKIVKGENSLVKLNGIKK